MALGNIDLNWIVALHALLQTSSVTKAAEKMERSQSSISHVLSHLREAMNDALLVRSGRRMVLTAKAQAMAPRVRQILADIETLFAVRDTAQDGLQGDVRIYIHELVCAAMLMDLDETIRNQAPATNLSIRSTLAGDVVDALCHERIDLAIDVYGTGPPYLEAQPLMTDRLVAVLRCSHPALTSEPGALSIERFAALPHLAIAQRRPAPDPVDAFLGRHGLTRRVARVVPGPVQALHVVAHTDYLTTIPERLAIAWAPGLDLRILELPVELLSAPLSMIWHRRHTADPAHGRLRELIARLATQRLRQTASSSCPKSPH